MEQSQKHHYHLVSGNVTGHFVFNVKGKLVDEITTFPVQAFITTESQDEKPLRVIAQAQRALQKQYESRLPKDDDTLQKIVDCQIHSFTYLGYMTKEQFFEGIDDIPDFPNKTDH